MEQISRYPLVLPPQNLSTRSLVDSTFRKYCLNYQVAMEVSGWEVIKKYVEMGLGISIVMSICLTGDEKLLVFAVDEYFPKKPYGIVLSKHKVLSPQARLFTTLLLSGTNV
jgi:DNA-binding transcriptional LysR family regulator